MPFLLPPLAAFMGGPQITVILIILLSISIPLAGIIGYFYTQQRREKLWHETARLALEKGLPIPAPPPSAESDHAAPFASPPPGVSHEQWDRGRRESKRDRDLKGGLVLLGIGIALSYANHGMAMPSYIMIGIGAALVLGVILTRNDHDHRGPPPQA